MSISNIEDEIKSIRKDFDHLVYDQAENTRHLESVSKDLIDHSQKIRKLIMNEIKVYKRKYSEI